MTRKITRSIALLLTGFLATSAVAGATADQFIKKFHRGINLGNLLEAPTDGGWGITLKEADFQLIASKGFTGVRIPISWNGRSTNPPDTTSFPRVGLEAPYTVNPVFFARVDSAVAWSRRYKLMAVINDHHHYLLFDSVPRKEFPRFLATWKQIAERYKDLPDSIAFEILNEPNTALTPDLWNELLDTTLKVIRVTNPTRPVVIGSANWGGIGAMRRLAIPADTNLILTIHYYEPFAFTHQGASWVASPMPRGVKWTGNYYEKMAIKQGIDEIEAFAKEKKLPVLLGEFGAYSAADSASRRRWTAYCARLFESKGFAWAYWEFKASFGVYNEARQRWNSTLMTALLSDDTTNLELGTPDAVGKEILTNGDFSKALDSLWVLSENQGKGTASLDNGAVKLQITEPSNDNWGLQFMQTPITIKEGYRYVMVFDAKASTPRTIDAEVGMAVEPWSTYGSASGVSVDTVFKTFYGGFQSASTDSMVRMNFNLGSDTATVWIDNVRLLEIAPVVTSVKQFAGIPTVALRQQGKNLRLSQTPESNRLMSLDGRVVQSLRWQFTGQDWVASVGNLPNGTYLLQHGPQTLKVAYSRR